MTMGPSRALTRLREMLAFVRGGTARDAEIRQSLAELPQLTARLATIEANLADWHAQLAALATATVAKAADADLQFVRQALAADLSRESQWLRDRITALAHAMPGPPTASAAGSQTQIAAPAGGDALAQAFYPALEQQFRGTAEEIRARQLPYKPWVDGLPPGTVADIGCGRGEWLGLLSEWGRDGIGVDLNPVLVDDLKARGLRAVHEDAVAWLRSQPSDSLSGITSFHVVEHLPMAVLLQLVDEARRALKPGGLLVLETPNPENLTVATQSFWLDPTHQRPLPPALLEFIAVHAGLRHETTLRLNPPLHSEPTADPTLRALVMQGRDYAVLARKPL